MICVYSDSVTHCQDLVSESHSCHGGWRSLGNEADEHTLVHRVHGDTTLALLVLTQGHLTDTWDGEGEGYIGLLEYFVHMYIQYCAHTYLA